MFLPHDIDTLDNFKRQTKRVIARLRKTGRPQVLTLNGRAAVIIQDAGAYEREAALRSAQDEHDTIAGIRESTAQLDRGEYRPAAAFFDELLGRVSKLAPRGVAKPSEKSSRKPASRRKAS